MSEDPARVEGGSPARAGEAARHDPPHPASYPTQVSRRGEDPHRVGRDPGRGRGLGAVPARGDSPHDLLQVAEGLHGGRQRADARGHEARGDLGGSPSVARGE